MVTGEGAEEPVANQLEAVFRPDLVTQQAEQRGVVGPGNGLADLLPAVAVHAAIFVDCEPAANGSQGDRRVNGPGVRQSIRGSLRIPCGLVDGARGEVEGG